VSVAKHTEVFLTFKRTDAEISDKLAIIEAKVAKAQQLAKERGKKPPLFWVGDAEQGA
jgi:succinyl-CoA synthetase beta subunit